MAAPIDSLTADALQIFHEALQQSSVKQAFAAKLPEIDFTGITRLIVIAMGKAGSSLLQAFLASTPIPPECALSGMLIAPSAPPHLTSAIAHFAGGHPLPNRDSFLAAQAALDLLRSAAADPTHRTSVVFLISGGASAMMELPLDASISLEDTIAFHHLLVECGASITEINCIRKHFSAVKGGRLALAAGDLPTLTILISDVPPGHLDTISSGPTIADTTTVEQCRAILSKYDLLARFPPPVRRFFDSDHLPETPKPGHLTQKTCVLLSSEDLANAAKAAAERLGYHTVLDQTCDDWEYSGAANYLIARIRGLQLLHPRVCLISTGELTVRLPQHPIQAPEASPPGIGGRNLHFALYSAMQLAITQSVPKPLAQADRIVILSAGSDGIDGNSPAAGAVVNSQTIAAHRAEATFALERFDSFTLLHQLHATLVTGPTNNNLRDLRILLADTRP